MSLLNTVRFIARHPLNRGQTIRALGRFVKWQIGCRLVPGAIVHDWIGGSRFLVRRGDTGLTGNIYAGLHEFPDMGFVLHVLRDEDLFVDVGANLGSYTILACSVAGARGLAFEPVPSTYGRLVENVRLNGLDDRVRCINKGVGEREGSIAFTSGSDTTNHALAPDERCESVVQVEMTTLDVALGDACPSVAKIDVEGYETSVLEGAEETLGKETLHSVIMELEGSGTRYGYDETKILELMSDHGFEGFSYDPFERILTPLAGRHVSSGNTLFIRNRSFVEDRVRSAPKMLVQGKEF